MCLDQYDTKSRTGSLILVYIGVGLHYLKIQDGIGIYWRVNLTHIVTHFTTWSYFIVMYIKIRSSFTNL